MPDLDPDQLQRLGRRSRFTEREIGELVADLGGRRIDYEVFVPVAQEAGIRSVPLQRRVWALFDADEDGTVAPDELVVRLSALLRGDVRDVVGTFFTLYDLDDDQRLDASEVVTVAGLWWEDVHGEPLTEPQVARIEAFVAGADEDRDGTLAPEEFERAVDARVQAADRARVVTTAAVLTGIGLFLLSAWFEMGTSFGLPSMGALALQMKARLAIDDAAIGQLTGYYYVAAIVGPLVGGYFIDRIGPAPVLVGANVLVALGALIQVLAPGFGVLVMGRIVMGLGGEVTAFATIEILAILFPRRFMLMCGLRNLVQSASCFLAFIVLPWLATERDTTFSLAFIVAAGLVSLLSSVVAWIYIRRRAASRAAKASPAAVLRALATRMVPQVPGRLARFRLPPSFFVAIFGIKAFYIPVFSFTAFSMEIFTGPKFGMSMEQAGFLSGFSSLLAGLSGPLFGPLSDVIGRRALSSAVFMVPAILAFCLFAFFDGLTPWVGVSLLALTYGYGDTCAFVSIRLIAGEKRAGIGYGVYSVLGNLVAFIVPVVGGYVIERHGQDTLLVYFAGLMALGMLCWVVVRWLEGPRSALALPARELVVTRDEVVDAAAMVDVARAGEPGDAR